MTKAMRPFEKDAMRLASAAYMELFINSSLGANPERLKNKSMELFKKGRLSSCERILAAVEGNPGWTLKTVIEEIKSFLKTMRQFKNIALEKELYQDHVMVQQFVLKYVSGEITGAADFLKTIESDKVENRNDVLAEAHFQIKDENNSIHSRFNIGKKIDIEFFTDRYLKSPEIFAAV